MSKMISAVELLERTSLGSQERHEKTKDSYILGLTDANEIYGYLQQDYENDLNELDDDGSRKQNEEFAYLGYLDGYGKRLQEAADGRKFQYEHPVGAGIADPVELDRILERSLLDYELAAGIRGGGWEAEEPQKVLVECGELREALSGAGLQDAANVNMLKHYVELLKLGNIKECGVSSSGSGTSSLGTDNEILMEELVSTLFSVAVQKNIMIPPPGIEQVKDISSRIKWFTECIYRLVEGGDGQLGSAAEEGNEGGSTSRGLGTTRDSPESASQDSATALNDLQFAHTYLSKKYQEEQLNHTRYVDRLTNRLAHCESLLRESNSELQKATTRALRAEEKISELIQRLDARASENHALITANNILRVDSLGSPVNIMGYNRIIGGSTPPGSPHGAGNSAADDSTGLLTPTDPPSVRILRMEFKRLVEQINARFAREIQQIQSEKKLVSDGK